MFKKIIRSEEEYYDTSPFAYSLKSFVDKNSQYTWFFKEWVRHDESDYSDSYVFFDSFQMEEYKDYLLSVRVHYDGNQYSFVIVSEVTG